MSSCHEIALLNPCFAFVDEASGARLIDGLQMSHEAQSEFSASTGPSSVCPSGYHHVADAFIFDAEIALSSVSST